MAPEAAPMALRAVMAAMVRIARRFLIFDLRFFAFVGQVVLSPKAHDSRALRAMLT
jgi:hypothetical protein